ncbi:hypothetical protein [Photobacterium kishitanii]|nr:hypothetical protein [Photobacterium kishitanii]
MKRKTKLSRYYSELKHIERQNPDSTLLIASVIARLKEIKEELKQTKELA